MGSNPTLSANFITQNASKIQSVAQTIARPARALNRTSIDILAYDLVSGRRVSIFYYN